MLELSKIINRWEIYKQIDGGLYLARKCPIGKIL